MNLRIPTILFALSSFVAIADEASQKKMAINPAEELGISLFSMGGDVQVKEVKSWTMKSISGK